MADEPRRFSFAELHACAEREVRQRRRVYPRWIMARRMTPSFADEEIAKMEAIAAHLAPLAEEERKAGDLFGGN